MQHLEGGIVREIKVREGDVVNRGDMVMILDDTAAKTQLNRLAKQWVSLSAQSQRLEAERDGRDIFNPVIAETISAAMLNVTDIVTEENKEFEARLARFRSEQLILGQRLNQLDDTGKGLRDQKAAIEMQAAVVRDEFARKQALLERSLIDRSD
ncbi:biotin/lipoyl-binding protein [Rhizobium leguminosarum]|uniref:biotin/lipoyl-binding protein n=1 Tax=Rhizobium leguminosarum TaxID=384 RepID=UPI0013EF1DA0|nr:biotin/lipoyl-binding protein [Rhizobium leguminosarum]